ncbi:MAG: transcription elongation factor GreB [Gammaproteobacteria bacterium]|jgi:transcription elongation factor GreB
MGRWRPPQPASSPYITRDGHLSLKTELDHLWRVRRPEVVRALSAAAAEGDRSENAEYIYRKKELGGIDYRVRYLKKRLEVLKVVDRTPTNTDQIYFGAWVELEDELDVVQKIRIVGPDEFDPDKSWVSMDSPIAKALMGKRVDDEINVQTPDGMKQRWVVSVWYQ